VTSSDTFKRLDEYLQFIKKRSTGELLTPATWMRKFVRNHEGYKGDSVVTEEIAHDLMVACSDIGLGKRHEPELLGDMKIEEIRTQDAYVEKLASKVAVGATEGQKELLRKYMRRASSEAT
jgi:glutamate--cysteine ligase catalytic subunit